MSKGKNVGCVEVIVFFVIINQLKNMFHEITRLRCMCVVYVKNSTVLGINFFLVVILIIIMEKNFFSCSYTYAFVNSFANKMLVTVLKIFFSDILEFIILSLDVMKINKPRMFNGFE